MRRTWEVLLAVLLATATVPIAGASSPPACEDVTRPTTATTNGYHVVVDNKTGEVRVWEETNGREGLQTQECEREDGTRVDADAHRATVPPVSIPELPTLGGLIETVIELCNRVTPYYDYCS